MSMCQLSKYAYHRLQYLTQDYESFYQEKSYDEFIQWNKECFEKLPIGQRKWMNRLCHLVENQSFGILDEETCVDSNATWVFFNKNGKICVMSPR